MTKQTPSYHDSPCAKRSNLIKHLQCPLIRGFIQLERVSTQYYQCIIHVPQITPPEVHQYYSYMTDP